MASAAPPPPVTTGSVLGASSYSNIGTFTPLGFQGYRTSYNWADDRAPYSGTNAPGQWRSDPGNIAYERFRMAELPEAKANPPFSSDAAGRLIRHVHVSGTDPDGQPARILRGFIRRAEYDGADELSKARLYFMYNPPAIVRDYVNYLDQGALDPFNTVFQSENLVAPPSVLNFSFELFFDRQDEARDPNNPGVLVDMEFFDMVVRNVIPDPAKQPLPDNGVMMVNPRDITVVFSPEISVQGRPLNASVAYEKFTHRMVPTRMRIQLQMRVVYFGPVRDLTTYTTTESVSTQAVGFTQQAEQEITFNWGDLEFGATGENVRAYIANQQATTTAASGSTNADALAHAKKQVAANSTQYDANKRNLLWEFADCSSLVWGAWAEIGHATEFKWPEWGSDGARWPPNTDSMHSGIQSGTWATKLWGYSGTEQDRATGIKKMIPGDLIFRIRADGDNHVAIIEKVDAAAGTFTVFHAASPSLDCRSSSYDIGGSHRYTHGCRLLPKGGTGSTTQNNDQSLP